MDQLWLWIGFNLFVLGMLAIDLLVFNREAHEIGTREAAIWSIVWIALALLFGLGVYLYLGHGPALEYLTGYLIEKALSVDNIFVFVLIFSYFSVPAKYQHRILFWGVLGALVMRGAMIGVGTYLIERFHWIIYLFGGFLIITGIRMAVQHDREIHPEANPVIRLVRRILQVTPKYHGQAFFIQAPSGPKGELQRMATPLFVVLVLVEVSDLIFALDSIPAIFAITRDPFIIYTSNVFAVLGLRALYFLLAGIIEKFRFLQTGLAVVLVFVGVKMVLDGIWPIPIGISLGVIAGILSIAIIASLISPGQA